MESPVFWLNCCDWVHHSIHDPAEHAFCFLNCGGWEEIPTFSWVLFSLLFTNSSVRTSWNKDGPQQVSAVHSGRATNDYLSWMRIKYSGVESETLSKSKGVLSILAGLLLNEIQIQLIDRELCCQRWCGHWLIWYDWYENNVPLWKDPQLSQALQWVSTHCLAVQLCFVSDSDG